MSVIVSVGLSIIAGMGRTIVDTLTPPPPLANPRTPRQIFDTQRAEYSL